MVKRLIRDGHRVTVLDNLSTGHREAVRDADFVMADLLDTERIERALRAIQCDAVLHFAALSVVADSMRDPYAYYRNNVAGTLSLLQAMNTAGTRKLIFSSSAAVYGLPQTPVLHERHVTQPINPYGATKLVIERLLGDASRAYGLDSVTLRYFNAAGADAEGELGESHEPETHLIPNVLRSALGAGSAIRIYGDDYPTPDGTCIRDYIHVEDLVDGHAQALEYLNGRSGAFCFNLGSGQGYSVAEVVNAARRVTGRTIPVEIAPRRAGDPASLVASAQLAWRELSWQPRRSSLETILLSAWRWHKQPRY